MYTLPPQSNRCKRGHHRSPRKSRTCVATHVAHAIQVAVPYHGKRAAVAVARPVRKSKRTSKRTSRTRVSKRKSSSTCCPSPLIHELD